MRPLSPSRKSARNQITMTSPVCVMLVCSVAIAGMVNASTLQFSEAAWSNFTFTFSKIYHTTEEEQFRFTVFMKNMEIINAHNQLYQSGLSSYFLGLNNFADMTSEEIAQLLQRDSHRVNDGGGGVSAMPGFLSSDHLDLPATVDWRKKGYVTPVRFQGLCGSCWAFSALGALEGQHFKKTGVLRELSEQQLVDCSQNYGNHGCLGGDMGPTFSYIKDVGGVMSNEEYPYKAFPGKCHFNKSEVVATVTGHVTVPSNESALQAAVASVGPISVSMTTPFKFIFYRGGVFDDPQCVQHNLGDHAILAVGYGTYQGLDYWLIKNSFGTFWGMDGYGMMSRNKKNQCNIADGPTFPLV